MALRQSALSELPEAFRAGDGVDLIRDAVRVARALDSDQPLNYERPVVLTSFTRFEPSCGSCRSIRRWLQR